MNVTEHLSHKSVSSDTSSQSSNSKTQTNQKHLCTAIVRKGKNAGRLCNMYTNVQPDMPNLCYFHYNPEPIKHFENKYDSECPLCADRKVNYKLPCCFKYACTTCLRDTQTAFSNQNQHMATMHACPLCRQPNSVLRDTLDYYLHNSKYLLDAIKINYIQTGKIVYINWTPPKYIELIDEIDEHPDGCNSSSYIIHGLTGKVGDIETKIGIKMKNISHNLESIIKVKNLETTKYPYKYTYQINIKDVGMIEDIYKELRQLGFYIWWRKETLRKLSDLSLREIDNINL